MSRKTTGLPALYELMGRRGASSAPARAPDAIPPPVEEQDGSWLSPGRMLHLPVGYVFLGIACAIALAIGAYMLGFRQASESIRGEYEQNVLMNTTAVDPLATNDPMMDPEDSSSMREVFMAPAASNQDANAASRTGSDPAGTPSGWGPIFSDPRQNGLNYIILMQTTREGAERVAQFCRSFGLETYVVGRNNARTMKVIAFPGFTTDEAGSEKVRALEALIQRVGEKWKREQNGTTDFHDRYPSLFTD